MIIGGGPEVVEETLRHPVERVDYIEIDPRVIKLSYQNLPPEARKAFRQDRLLIHYTDGRYFVNTAGERYDSVILNLPDPYTALTNRFYTVEFFQRVKALLEQGGVFSFSVSSQENYIAPATAKLLVSLKNSLEEVFEEVRIIPGDAVYFLASPNKGTLTLDVKLLMKRMGARRIKLDYVREYYLEDRLSRQRLEFLQNTLKKARAFPNHDFRPIGYFYNLLSWARRFDSRLDLHLAGFEPGRVRAGAGALLLGLLSCILLIKRKLQTKPRLALAAVAATGLSEMSFQIMIIFSFQIIYGFLYYKLGIILTSFMIGLALGSWWLIKRMGSLKDDYQEFIKIQGLVTLYPLTIIAVVWALSRLPGPVINWWGSNFIFPLLPLAAGFIGGAQFPLGCRIYQGSAGKVAESAGVVYAADLAGAAVGAVLISTILIPVIGIFESAVFISLLNLVILILLRRLHR